MAQTFQEEAMVASSDLPSGTNEEQGFVPDEEIQDYESLIYQNSLNLLNALGYEPTQEDCTVLQFCIQSAMDRARRFCNSPQVPRAMSVLVRMTLGEFLTYLRGAARSFSLATGMSGELKTIKEGDVSITYETGSSNTSTVSSDSMIASFCDAVKELTAERKLLW